jgi:RecB family exonuclease
MTDARTYTSSELSQFRNCRREWWLRQYRRLKLKPQFEKVSAAHLGTLVHACLEIFYDPNQHKRAWVDALSIERERLHDLLEDGKVFEQWYDAMIEQVEYARIIVDGYIEWTEEEGVDQGIQFLSTETKVEAIIEGVKFLAKMDAIVLDEDEMLMFLDHKTAQSFPLLWKGLLIREQFLHYEMLNRATSDTPTAGVLVNGLRKVKRSSTSEPPYYERNRRYFGKTQVDNYQARALAIVKDIESVTARLDAGESHQTAAYARPNSDCHWRCEFFNICHMFDDGSRVEDFLEEYYEAGDPLERYDEKETINE